MKPFGLVCSSDTAHLNSNHIGAKKMFNKHLLLKRCPGGEGGGGSLRIKPCGIVR